MEEIKKSEVSTELSALQEQESELLLWARNEVECKLRIGKALKTIRDASLYKEAGFKSFGEYLDNRAFESLKIGQTQGYKYVKAYEVYGNRLHVPNTTNLDVLIELSKMPDEEVEKLEAEGRIEDMTSKEAERLRKELEQANRQISLLNGDIEKALEENKAEIAANQSKTNEALSKKDDEIIRLKKEIKELEKRPIEVNAKPSDEDIAKIKQQAEAEAKGAAEAEISAAKEEAARTAKAYEGLIAEKTSADDRIKELEAKLQSSEKPADEKLIEFKFYFQETQANLKKFLDVINKVDDAEKKAKFKGAAKKFVTAILEELDKVEG